MLQSSEGGIQWYSLKLLLTLLGSGCLYCSLWWMFRIFLHLLQDMYDFVLLIKSMCWLFFLCIGLWDILLDLGLGYKYTYIIQSNLVRLIKLPYNLIIQIMSWISTWFKPNKNPKNTNHTHSQISQFCCSDLCRYEREVCKECVEDHKGHILMEFKKYKKIHEYAREEISTRRKIEDTFREFHQHLVSSFQAVLEKEAVKFMEQIDKKVYTRNFMEIYKRDLAGKHYYSFLPEFQTSLASDVNNLLQKTIKDKKLKIVQLFRQFISDQRMIVDEYLLVGMPKLRDNPSQTKLDKVKTMMPFSCQLTPKFQASKHRFQTDKLHKIGIRGPIVLVAESYKGNIFGGFAPKMFPKNQEYEQDIRGRSFLFSVDHCKILPIKEQYKKFAIKGGNNLWFGRGDLVIADECNKGNISWAQIGRAYELPPGINTNPDEWLAGALYFQIIEYQIYEVSFVRGQMMGFI